MALKKVKITVMCRTEYKELMEKYENPILHGCDMIIGQSFISVDGEKPSGFCNSAWENLHTYVKVLAHGGGNFFDGWMKNPYSAMISCNDGFRPVSFYLETLE